MSQTKEVAAKKSTELAAFDPAMFEADAGQGMENMGQDDLALPFLKVLSGNDPILDENEVARKGDIYNTVTGMVYNTNAMGIHTREDGSMTNTMAMET